MIYRNTVVALPALFAFFASSLLHASAAPAPDASELFGLTRKVFFDSDAARVFEIAQVEAHEGFPKTKDVSYDKLIEANYAAYRLNLTLKTKVDCYRKESEKDERGSIPICLSREELERQQKDGEDFIKMQKGRPDYAYCAEKLEKKGRPKFNEIQTCTPPKFTDAQIEKKLVAQRKDWAAKFPPSAMLKAGSLLKIENLKLEAVRDNRLSPVKWEPLTYHCCTYAF